jgi:ribosomal protein L18E
MNLGVNFKTCSFSVETWKEVAKKLKIPRGQQEI